MTRSISSVLREAAKREAVPWRVGDAVKGVGDKNDNAFKHVWYCFCVGEYFADLTNEERSAFLYLCSLIAEDEE